VYLADARCFWIAAADPDCLVMTSSAAQVWGNTGERGREVALSLFLGLLCPGVPVSRDVAVCLQAFDEACGGLSSGGLV
jgi:hypothetical protein